MSDYKFEVGDRVRLTETYREIGFSGHTKILEKHGIDKILTVASISIIDRELKFEELNKLGIVQTFTPSRFELVEEKFELEEELFLI